jgi:sigma-B regulation protein RsbU (phosphoserine phosphatase)
VQVVDTSRNVRLAILMEMLEDVSRATDPEQAVHAWSRRIGRLRPVAAMLALSQRNLPPGQYKITRKVINEAGLEARHQIVNPWKNWSILPTFTGGFLGELIATPEPRLVQDLFLKNDPVLGDLLSEMGSCVAVPVFDGGRVLNWTLQFRREAQGFTIEDLEQNVLTGNLFGAMTRNLVNLDQIKRLNEKLHQQFDEVARVQQALLPRTVPDVRGLRIATSYLPSEQAGGDYYDFFQLPDGSLGIVIADVSGHGPGAATVMAMLHAMIHAFPGGAGQATPAEVIRHANRQLVSANMDGAFATAVVMRYKPQSRTFVYAIAGHPPPRLISPGHGEVRSLEGEATLPMGIVEDLEIPVNRVTLAPGEGLVLFTDGITEAFNEDRDMFGIDGLDRSIAAAAPPREPDTIIDAIHASVYHHTGTRARADDQTVVAMKVV